MAQTEAWIAMKLCIYVIIMFAAIFGNILIFIAVGKFQYLRTVSNTFIVSLASADLLVASVTLPLSIQEAYFEHWYLGEVMCRLWVCGDVFFVTISILHLAVISVDRYRSIKDPLKYSLKRTTRLAYKHIGIAWVLSLFIGVPAFFLAVFDRGACYLNPTPYFIVPGTMIGFYIPLVIVLMTNKCIYSVAKKHATRVAITGPSRLTMSEHGASVSRRQDTVNTVSVVVPSTTVTATNIPIPSPAAGTSSNDGEQPTNAQPNKISIARERKAARTVAIVIGVFTVCWLPFFLALFVLSLCVSCNPDNFHLQDLTWLGYANSAANPVIYTIFNKDFRRAFWKILRCKIR